MKYYIEKLISSDDINSKVNYLGKQITQDYFNINKKFILIGLLRGSFIFVSDLCRVINIPHEVDFMTVSSYGSNMFSSRDVKIIKDLDGNIYDKDVLIVEDIIDSGYTISKVYEMLLLRKPNSLSICTLLDKPSCREVNIFIKYIGFTISNEFVIGYGIDYNQNYRHLSYIGKVVVN
ncbi:hypoxanthine phosphoribosyltransferase [Candidatus Purcelliella pentastirinorum]|uniref:Hypoxanthine phosphoribosyltransferase n=1 Tax=Candidatus Purcelliella pentastirinorum TaxID=472834 RepID=A0AAX3N7E5_9ENTR|nr:hypoxanthine phosphoribosyltransferase [Candidatus Purcelliella pentastirinorum]WDI78467.1 hypoxanthine phosphoribosyltransferase [Candidatus Purcelliella pentastirinorum]WDR80504.1 hypoxanthine phosphoribosyltransferase [Candidatus Purcelliella pentastirinorum]